MVILGIYGKPFDLFEINNSLNLDFTQAFKENPKIGESLKMKMVFYEIPNNEVEFIKIKFNTLYSRLKDAKRDIEKISETEYKLNGSLFYLVDLDKPSKLAQFTIKKLTLLNNEQT